MASALISRRERMAIANSIINEYECEMLAEMLNVDEHYFSRTQASGVRDVRQIALKILKEWQREEGDNATKQALLDALSTDELHHLRRHLLVTSQGKKRKEKQSSSHEETASEEDGTNLGKELRQGMKVLLKISRAVSSLEDVIAIATDLLEGIEPTGGRAWVESKKSHGGVLNPSRTAHDLFEYWCKKSPTVPYGGRLLQVLKEVVPEVGRKFESELL